jgi:hypothetical protein
VAGDQALGGGQVYLWGVGFPDCDGQKALTCVLVVVAEEKKKPAHRFDVKWRPCHVTIV